MLGLSQTINNNRCIREMGTENTADQAEDKGMIDMGLSVHGGYRSKFGGLPATNEQFFGRWVVGALFVDTAATLGYFMSSSMAGKDQSEM